MKQFKSLPCGVCTPSGVLRIIYHFQSWLATPTLSITIVLILTSYLSAAETFWDDWNPASPHYSKVGTHFNGDFPGLTEFNTFKILLTTDSVQWYWDPETDKLSTTEFQLPIMSQVSWSRSIAPEDGMPSTKQKSQIFNEPLMLRTNFWSSTQDPISPLIVQSSVFNVPQLRTQHAVCSTKYYCEIGTHPDWPHEWNSGIQPDSNPADDIIFYYDEDYIRSMRIPAPASLLLVAFGLLSLRFIRRLRY